jgi:hypothetical protein
MIKQKYDIKIDKNLTACQKIRRIDHNQIIRHNASKNSSRKHINITDSD